MNTKTKNLYVLRKHVGLVLIKITSSNILSILVYGHSPIHADNAIVCLRLTNNKNETIFKRYECESNRDLDF